MFKEEGGNVCSLVFKRELNHFKKKSSPLKITAGNVKPFYKQKRTEILNGNVKRNK